MLIQTPFEAATPGIKICRRKCARINTHDLCMPFLKSGPFFSTRGGYTALQCLEAKGFKNPSALQVLLCSPYPLTGTIYSMYSETNDTNKDLCTAPPQPLAHRVYVERFLEVL